MRGVIFSCVLGLMTGCYSLDQQSSKEVVYDLELEEAQYELAEASHELNMTRKGPKFDPVAAACFGDANECRQECLNGSVGKEMAEEMRQCHDSLDLCLAANPEERKQCQQEFKQCHRDALGSMVSAADKSQMRECMLSCRDAFKQCLDSIDLTSVADAVNEAQEIDFLDRYCGWNKPGNGNNPSGSNSASTAAKECHQECLTTVVGQDALDALKLCYTELENCMTTNPDDKCTCRRDFRECRRNAKISFTEEEKAQMKECLQTCRENLKNSEDSSL